MRRALIVAAAIISALIYAYVVVELVTASEVERDAQHWSDGL